MLKKILGVVSVGVLLAAAQASFAQNSKTVALHMCDYANSTSPFILSANGDGVMGLETITGNLYEGADNCRDFILKAGTDSSKFIVKAQNSAGYVSTLYSAFDGGANASLQKSSVYTASQLTFTQYKTINHIEVDIYG